MRPGPPSRGPAAARRWLACLCLAVLVCALGCGPVRPRPGDRDAAAGTAERVDRALARYSEGVSAGLWLEGLSTGTRFRRAASAPLPAASAIKTAYLVELFDAFPDLDAPLPGVDGVLDDSGHPAVAHFDAATRREIRRELGGATVRRIARAMIRGDDVSNAVYNAAANLVTAALGGPARLTSRLHGRDSAWRGLHVRRYMLAARDVTGDNEATAASLAAVLRGIATGTVPGLDPELYGPMREILAVESAPVVGMPAGAHFFKSGALDSVPPVRILSGWWERPGREALLYVVIVSRPDAGGDGERLQEIAEELRETLLAGASAGVGSGPAR